MFTQAQIEKVIYKTIKTVKTFPAVPGDTFAAHSAAVAFLKEKGYSVGSMQRGSPIGVAKGDCDISKWRNLGPDVKELDGVLVSDSFREGSVTLYLAQAVE